MTTRSAIIGTTILLSIVMSASSPCGSADQQPSVCILTSDLSTKETINDIKEAMVSWDNNKTVAIGEDAEFVFVISKDYLFKSYINGCSSGSVCSLTMSADSSTLTCTIKDVHLSDNLKKISVYAFDFNTGAAVCFNTSYLLVYEAAAPVVTTVTVHCNEVCVNISNTSISNGVRVQYALVHDGMTVSSGSSNRTNICFLDKFRNSSGHYWVSLRLLSSNGRSNATNVTVKPSNNEGVWSVPNVSVRVVNGIFWGVVTIESNNSCPLLLLLSSNCSNHNVSFGVLPHFRGGINTANISLQHEKQRCEVAVASGDHNDTIIVQGTFHVKMFKCEVTMSTVKAVCSFTPGSTINGCHIKVNGTSIQTNIQRNSSNNIAQGSVSIPTNGIYVINVYDWLGNYSYSSVVSSEIVHVYNQPTTTRSQNKNLDIFGLVLITVFTVLSLLLIIGSIIGIAVSCYHYRQSKTGTKKISNGYQEEAPIVCQYHKKEDDSGGLAVFLTGELQANSDAPGIFEVPPISSNYTNNS